MNNTDRKKLLGFILSGALILGMWMPAGVRANDVGDTFKADTKTHKDIFNGSSTQYKGKTVILHSNDVHGAIAGYAYIAELEDDFEEAGAEVITMDAGDYSQGTSYVSSSMGASAVSLMNEAGYEFSTLGNHEFDYGWAQLKSNLSDAKFKVLCADVTDRETGKTIFDANNLYTTKGGVKIGIFGMETPETQTKANPSLIKGLIFASNSGGKTGLYDCAKEQVASLKTQGADLIVGLTHLGMDSESSGDGHRSVDLYDHVDGIDFIIDAHSHDTMTEGLAGEPIQSTGTKFENIGVVVIDETSKKIEEHYLVATEGLDKDPVVEAAAKKIIDDIDAKLGHVIATSEVAFTGEKSDNRCHETNTGDLITDAMVWAIKDRGYTINVDDDHVVAIENGGSIRSSINIGDVTKQNIKDVLPYDNTFYVIYVKGSELLEALEASTFDLPNTIGGYPQTKGIRFNIDTTKPYDQGELYPNSTYYAPKSIQRVKILSVNGKAYSENDIYVVVTNSYIGAGGDTYYPFSAATESFNTWINEYEAVVDYIEKGLEGKLTSERYGEVRGDATYEAAPAAPKLSTVKAGKKKLTVKWKKAATSVTGYQISYSTSKKFTKKTTKTIKVSGKKVNYTIKKLTAKKTYYVRVRAYNSISDGTLYSPWSAAKKAKVA